MAELINLTIARSLSLTWDELNTVSPYNSFYLDSLHQLVNIKSFEMFLSKKLLKEISQDNIDLICWIIENYFPAAFEKIPKKEFSYYLTKRIANCQKIIQNKNPEKYEFAFKFSKINEKDSRSSFLLQMLNFVDIIDKNHATIEELLDTPFSQLEQMINYICTFPHERIPDLLEKMSYSGNLQILELTIPSIGNYKNIFALKALKRLENYYLKENEQFLPIIRLNLQKLFFNQPRINDI